MTATIDAAGTQRAASATASLRHLLGRLAIIEQRIAHAVGEFRAVDPNPDDGFRGLYVSDEQVDQMLREGPRALPRSDDTAEIAVVESEADRHEAAGAILRLRHLEKAFGIDALDIDLLLVAMAPDLDQRFERLFGYLHDDVTRRRASPGLAIELAGRSKLDPEARARVSSGAPLLRHQLLMVEDPERPFLTRSLRVPDRVLGFLLGDDGVDGELTSALRTPPELYVDLTERVARVLEGGHHLVHMRQTSAVGAESIATAAFASLGQRSLTIDFGSVDDVAHLQAVVRSARREARLTGAGLIGIAVHDLPVWAIRELADDGLPTVLVGSTPWDPNWASSVPHREEVMAASPADRRSWWRSTLDQGSDTAIDDDELTALSSLQLGPAAMQRSITAARARARADDTAIETQHLVIGAREQNSTGLEKLARRITPSARWTDMVLPPDTMEQLHHLSARVSQRSTVLDTWGLRRGGGRGEGITALFSGDSGTGKTMAAEVIASELGLDLYVIDLSTVVDKYIGETEKNLERIFTEAEGINGVLFFDEADALFGNRSEVSDAKDRYANVEVAYLLQRMESFDGLAVLASNLKANLDEAFARRLSITVDFPMPEADERYRLWEHHTTKLPLAEDTDLTFMATRFELSGGNIRNVAVTAAYLAANEGSEVSMDHLIRATQIEYRKLGRLLVEAEFGAWLPTLNVASP